MQQTRRLYRLFLLLVLMMPAACFAAQAELKLSSIQVEKAADNSVSNYLDAIIIEAFRRIKIKATIVFLPAERSLHEANLGRVDGDFLRVSGLSKIYHNLIKVPEPFFSIEYVAFVNDENTRVKRQEIQSWNDLSDYTVGAVIGWKEVEFNTKFVRHRSLVSTKESLFKMLKMGRIDVAIFNEYLGKITLKNLKLIGISAIKPSLSKKTMHIYLHKKHRAIIPKLSASIKSMKANGDFDRFFEGMSKTQTK